MRISGGLLLIASLVMMTGCKPTVTEIAPSTDTVPGTDKASGPPPGMMGAPAAGGGGGAPGGGGGPQFDLQQIFQQRDVNQDGKLTGDEIPEQLRPHVETLDTDGDGSISREEFQEGIRHIESAFYGGQGGGFGPRGMGGDQQPDDGQPDDGQQPAEGQ